MAAFNKFQCLVENIAEGVHDFGSDTLTVALCAAANAPVATNTVLADLTEISYTNLSARVLTVSSSSQTSGTYKLIVDDLVLTASAAVAAFRYIVIYNDTAANDPLIGWYDYGSELTLAVTGDTLTIDLSAVNGLLQMV